MPPVAAKFTFGRNSIIRVTAVDPTTGVKVATANASKLFCLTNKVTLGLTNGTVTIENFCTGGADVEVPDGTTVGKLEFGDTQWTKDDEALVILEAAARNDAGGQYGNYVMFDVYPIGVTTGNPMYSMLALVKEWQMDIPAKGTITVTHNVAIGKPDKGVAA